MAITGYFISMKNELVWNEESRRTVFCGPIFSVGERVCRSPDDALKTYSVLDTSDWAIVIPEIETERGGQFIMVRQWRPGSGALSLEFPGGVLEENEDAAAAAARELLEETGYRAGKIEKLGEFNPNPAIMSNRVHFFLARDLEAPVAQDLDDDEYVEVETIAREEAINGMGKAPYIHALMGTAIALYLQKKADLNPKEKPAKKQP